MVHFFWLLPFFVLALWQYPHIENWPDAWLVLVIYSPYVLASLGIFISFWLNRIQPAFFLLTLVFLNLAINYFFGLEDLGLTYQVLYPVLSILLSLNLLIWLFVPEKGFYSKYYVASLLSLFVVQMLFVFWYIETLPSYMIDFLSVAVKVEVVNLPMIPLVIGVLTWMFLVIKNAMSHHIKVLDTTVIFVLLLMLFGLNSLELYGFLAWVSAISALIIILSMVFDSHHLAYIDELTKLKGRRALFESFSGLGRQYTIAMMDIDHFKKFNDSYGHDIGDSVLAIVAKKLSLIREGSVFRYGGEEFTLLFKGKTPQEIKLYIEEVREAIANHNLMFETKGKSIKAKLTVSFGVAEKTPEHSKPEDVMKLADKALYQAKSAGRNCTVIFGDKPVTRRST